MDKLIDLHHKYLTFIRHMVDFRELACVVWDYNGRFVYCNSRFARLLGYKKEDISGKKFVELIHPDDAERSQAEYDKNTQNGLNLMHRFVNRYKHKDGRWIWLTWHVAFNDEALNMGAGEVSLSKEHEIPRDV